MKDAVKIVECPRDAWQGLPSQIPAEVKAEYLRRVIAAGFTHIDAVSFVSPAAVPQMADSEQVLDELLPSDDVEIIGIVVNEKGAQRAIETGSVRTLGFPYSISPHFLERNQKQTPEQALDTLDAIGTLAQNAELQVVAYLSMAFGNPYGDAWSLDEVISACDLLVESGVEQISLADTVGLASASLIGETVAAVHAAFPRVEIGVHLHSRRADAAARIRAAYEAGCRRFDAAIGGFGGCPFAQDALVGNIPTETLVATLNECGAKLPDLGPLDELMRVSAEIARRFGPVVN
ncbi:MAG TPA: hydroxymethylglutaryl-CoA lyase [Acidobacteriaceae bacterium]|jgi:hydroxymethylglutaryl-CoA lyase